MQTFEMYFSGPSMLDSELPFAPSPEEVYNDFREVMKKSGYTILTSKVLYSTLNTRFFTIEVSGIK